MLTQNNPHLTAADFFFQRKETYRLHNLKNEAKAVKTYDDHNPFLFCFFTDTIIVNLICFANETGNKDKPSDSHMK